MGGNDAGRGTSISIRELVAGDWYILTEAGGTATMVIQVLELKLTALKVRGYFNGIDRKFSVNYGEWSLHKCRKMTQEELAVFLLET